MNRHVNNRHFWSCTLLHIFLVVAIHFGRELYNFAVNVLDEVNTEYLGRKLISIGSLSNQDSMDVANS